ncbi:hypothetical protein BCIN_16g01630 [Botrytis cinerea B05.10]|uniref:Uncharacterized protein n=1 Tax=Botryotinia fuckeliana (strain B05.10) TaxID=332648 RepID=A0A384K6F9_BOTFB|nr:hypothetical protein BCIN_16g01630 [Botrytis cinerea B05.10]ATZ58351.1 hypothetical protein BCIN_16g01630 [Botrytis cinerea B05.10]
MYPSLSLLLLATRVFASPAFRKRVVASLDQTAFEEAQQRDNTAARAFTTDSDSDFIRAVSLRG